MRSAAKHWILLALAFCTVACDRRAPDGAELASVPVQATAAAHSADWDTLVAGYLEEYFAANPVFAVFAGRHEFDGRMQDFSAPSIANTGLAAKYSSR